MDPYLPRNESVGPCPREARNRYRAVAFAPFALCGACSRCRSGPSALWRCCRVGSSRVGSLFVASAVEGRWRSLGRGDGHLGSGTGGRSLVVVFVDAPFTISESARSPLPTLVVFALFSISACFVPRASFAMDHRLSASKTAPRPGLRGATHST